MSDLTLQQEIAIATFKGNIHFPGGGFHGLIIELCKEYQLPFQTVRAILMDSQASIEKKIRDEFDSMDDNELTQQAWLDGVNETLKVLAKEEKSVMEKLIADENYLKAVAALDAPVHSEYERECIMEYLMLAYEKQVLKPLLAMLHTSPRYWELMLAEELCKMTQNYRLKFSDYPQHMHAAELLFEMDSQVRSRLLDT